ncbi:MAG: hypothetical protein ACE5NN_01020 [Candidatus Bathyarchaeia archaeon]
MMSGKEERKGWRLDNADLTLKVADLEKRILNLEKRIARVGNSHIKSSRSPRKFGGNTE